MKLSKLYLKAFGPYTERVLDFSASNASLHIIYGPNEAGKSSLLRAIRALFFGIDERTQDNFLHENTSLRVGGVITDGKGLEFPLMRRKARRQSLREWNGKVGAEIDCEGNSLPDNAIATLFGGIDEAQFSRLFGIDRTELIEGGEAILKGHGDVGESLFEAGAGLVGLRRLRENLEAEAGDLFAPRASKPLINSTITKYDESRRQAKEHAVKTEEWTRRDEAHSATVARLAVNRETLTKLRLEREKLGRILRNLPIIARREECIKELAHLSGVPDLPLDFTEKRASAVAARVNALRQRDDVQQKVDELEAQLRSIDVPTGYIERQALIQGIYSRLGAFQDAELEVPGLQVKQDNFLDAAAAKLQTIGFSGEVSSAESLRPKRGDETKLRSMISEHADLSGRLAELRLQETNLQVELEKAEFLFSALIAPKNIGPLEEGVQTGSEHTESERRLTELQNELHRRDDELKRKARHLGDRTATELRELRLPLRATLQRLQHEADTIASEQRVLSAQLLPRRADLTELQADKSRLEEAGLVPSESELASARERRDLGWNLVRQAYIERTADPDVLNLNFSQDAKLPEAYESAVEQADIIADGLRHDTKRMTEHSLANDRIAQITGAIDQDEARLKDLDIRRQAWKQEWTAINSSLGTTYATVRELEAWLTEQGVVVASLDEIENRQAEVKTLQNAVTAARRRVSTEIEAYGANSSELETLAALLIRARDLLEKARRDVLQYDKAEKAVEEMRIARVGHEKRLNALHVDMETWRSRWRPVVTALRLDERAEPAEAESQLDIIEEIFRAIDEADRVGRELVEKEASIQRYVEEVRGLATALGVTLEKRPIGDVVAQLFMEYQEAQSNVRRRDQISDQLERERRALVEAGHEAEIRGAELADLCLVARVADVVELEPVEVQSNRKRQLSLEVGQIESQLIEQNSGPLDRILGEAAPVDGDSLNARIPAIDAEIQEADASQIVLAQHARDTEVALQEVDGSAKAAEAAQATEELLARLRYATEDYARLKISSFVIARAIAAYRDKNQGPLVKRASEYFKALTLGSFSALDVDFSEDDRQVLVGVRGNGKRVTVEGMSEGARDQLYFALRLAAIERQIKGGPTVPVIVDDILVQFDDNRVKPAFKALEMLATQTQVLVLTHHEHLLPLVEQATTKGALAVHRLELPTGV